MKTDLNVKELTAGFSHFIHRYHVLIFVLLVLGGLSAATFMLYQTATSAQTTEQTSAQTTFDKNTISKIEQLRSSTDTSTPLVLPEGRTNPFKE